MPAYAPSLKQIDREQDVLNDPVYRGYRPVLMRFVSQLQAAHTDQQLMDLQLALIGQAKAHQDVIRDLRSEIENLREQRTEEVKRTPKRIDRLKQIQEGIALREHQLRVQEALRFLWLSVGDGIVWKRCRYDRTAITVLGQGQRVAWLSEGPGWEAELAALEQYWRSGYFGLLCDMTTCLRHGDLMVFEPTRTVVYEIKASKTAGAASPQMRRLAEATELINKGHGTIDGQRRAIVRCPTPFRSFLDVLGPLLAEAKRKGEAWRYPSPAHFVVAYDMTHFRKDNNRIPTPIDERVRRSTRFPEGDIVLHHGSMIRRMRDRQHSFATLAPITILPLAAEDICDLLLGTLIFTTLVSVSSVARRLRAAGYEVTPYGPPESGDAFMTVERIIGRQQLTCRVAPHFREMMMLELMTPANVHAAVDTLMRFLVAGPDRDIQHMLVMSDEARVWGRRP